MRLLTLLSAVMLAVLAAALPATAAPPGDGPGSLARAHAHNDYEHQRPLVDALDHGFASVEADIWLVDGQLLVAHDREDVQPGRTLRSLYLQPLLERVHRNHGEVYAGDEHTFTLLLDIKSAGEPTYRALHRELRHFQRMLTRFTPGGAVDGPVTAIVSGDRPRGLMQQQRVRYAAYDGRLSDLDSGATNTFIPLISDNWTTHFSWQGVGEMPTEQRERLHEIVDAAHADGRRVRFWATPDDDPERRRAVWRELLAAGADYLNTDHLGALQSFLEAEDLQPSLPHVPWWSTGSQPGGVPGPRDQRTSMASARAEVLR